MVSACVTAGNFVYLGKSEDMEKFDYASAVARLEKMAAQAQSPETPVEDIRSMVKESKNLVKECRDYLRSLRDDIDGYDEDSAR